MLVRSRLKIHFLGAISLHENLDGLFLGKIWQAQARRTILVYRDSHIIKKLSVYLQIIRGVAPSHRNQRLCLVSSDCRNNQMVKILENQTLESACMTLSLSHSSSPSFSLSLTFMDFLREEKFSDATNTTINSGGAYVISQLPKRKILEFDVNFSREPIFAVRMLTQNLILLAC